jgi:uncharacterized protein (DUF983 family)
MIPGVTCECPVCGNTDLRRNPRTGKLECQPCRDDPRDIDRPSDNERRWNEVL